MKSVRSRPPSETSAERRALADDVPTVIASWIIVVRHPYHCLMPPCDLALRRLLCPSSEHCLVDEPPWTRYRNPVRPPLHEVLAPAF